MKNSFKIVSALLICMAVIYTSCKKTQVAATDPNSSNADAVSQQIALSLYKSISGKYGGANISDGIKAPSGVSPSIKGPRVNSVEPYCGYTIDTTLNFTTPHGDTSTTVGSHYKFTYTCSTSSLDGYILSDSITYQDQGALFSNKFITGQNYTVQSGGNFSSVSMTGTIGTSYHYNTYNNMHTLTAFNYADSKYSLHSLTVAILNGTADITAGNSTFSSTITNMDQTTPPSGIVGKYTGTLEFLGNHTGKITLKTGGNTYVNMVNLLTGELTAVN